MTFNSRLPRVQAFISCRLDYCNSLLFGIRDGLLRRLQSVQNAAARLVTGARRCDHSDNVIILVYSRLMKQFVFVKIDLGIYILRPKMVFAVYYLSTDIVSVNNFVC